MGYTTIMEIAEINEEKKLKIAGMRLGDIWRLEGGIYYFHKDVVENNHEMYEAIIPFFSEVHTIDGNDIYVCRYRTFTVKKEVKSDSNPTSWPIYREIPKTAAMKAIFENSKYFELA